MGTTAKVMAPVPGAPVHHATYGHFAWLQDQIADRCGLTGGSVPWRTVAGTHPVSELRRMDPIWWLLGIDPTDESRSAIPGAYCTELADRLEQVGLAIGREADGDAATVQDAMIHLAHMAREAAESGGLLWWN